MIETKLAEIETEATQFQDVIKDEIEMNKSMLDTGNVKLFMDQLATQEKVGQPFSYREKLALFTEGDSRFLRKLPQGYMDEKEKDKKDETKTQKFGDLIVWKQQLLFAEESGRPVVFITNDNKPDWWKLNQDGRPESPRPELIEEFSCYSDQSFIMVGMGEFLDHLSQIFDFENSLAYLELNAEELVDDLMTSAGWQETLDENVNFTSYLIHSGDLQFAVGNPLTDVEVIEFSQGVIDIESVVYDGTIASLAGTFSIEAEVTIEQYGDQPVEGEVKVSGMINVQFELDAENKEDKIKQDTVKLQLGGFEVTKFVEYTDAEDSVWASVVQ
ncbi:PIN-like domain-containing protein [Paenibacillus sp. Leaf72]|uniref:PIN-like domain-containing protein n=1 Tax=Paenibacillus sp. Leaf72 TaxID=1736234 RepID=UPI00228622E2